MEGYENLMNGIFIKERMTYRFLGSYAIEWVQQGRQDQAWQHKTLHDEAPRSDAVDLWSYYLLAFGRAEDTTN
jgi:hypothetical protein